MADRTNFNEYRTASNGRACSKGLAATATYFGLFIFWVDLGFHL